MADNKTQPMPDNQERHKREEIRKAQQTGDFERAQRIANFYD